MFRKQNTDRAGNSWSDKVKLAVWNKGTIVPGYNSALFRKDTCGAFIEWAKYGETIENGYGWEIDHIKPISEGGSDDLTNLQPLQWQNNRAKADNYPAFNFCSVKALT